MDRRRLICYYLLFVTAVVLVLALLRIVNSPFGRCCRPSAKRVPRRGHWLPRGGVPHARPACCRPCSPRWRAACWRSGCATTGRTPRSFEIMMDVPAHRRHRRHGHDLRLGHRAVLFLVAQSYLQDLLRLGSEAASGLPRCCRRCCRPTAGCCGWASCLFCRSLLSTGVVGRLRAWRER